MSNIISQTFAVFEKLPSAKMNTIVNEVNAHNHGSAGGVSVEIPDLSISTEKLQDGSVTPEKLSGGGGTETGVVKMWAGSLTSPPTGWLLCDGSAVSRTTYSALNAILKDVGGVDNYAWGSGDGSTTFNLPNFTNRFPYGASEGSAAGNASVGSAGGVNPGGNDNSLTIYQGLKTNVTDGGGGTAAYRTNVMSPYAAVGYIIKT